MQALLWEKKQNNNVQCNICYNRCIIAPGNTSRCFSRKNVDGEMQLNTYARASSIAVDPIEKKPLYRFHPGTKVFSVGSWGCNFECEHCQNWQISQQMLENKGYHLPPEKMIELALEHKCQGVCWTYNEPAIWLEYTIDSGRLAKEKGLYTAYVTNGHMTIEALDLIAPYLDAFRVDLKDFDRYKGVLETTKHAKELGMHVEAVTNIVPTKNDSGENLTNIANWIANNLGTDTAWHVTRFFPCYKLTNLQPTPLETLYKAREIGEKIGLKYIYLGNI